MTDTEPGYRVTDRRHGANPTPPTPDDKRPANVIEALTRCVAEMPAVGKDQTMGSREGGGQSYNYRSIEAITSAASVLFGKYGVLIKPHQIDRLTPVKQIQVGDKGKMWDQEELIVFYRIYGPGGLEDYIDTAGFVGLARDNSDKGTNKAMTQAYKQMLLQILVVGDNKDDPDSYSHEDRTDPAQHVPATMDEWARLHGYEHGEHSRKAAVAQAVAALKVRREQGDLTEDEARQAWEDYKHPERLEGGEGPRYFDEHLYWWQETFGEFAPDLPIPGPDEESASSPDSPANATGTQPARTAPPTPETPAETLAAEARSEPPAEVGPGTVEDERAAGNIPQDDPQPVDNGTRTDLDRVWANAGGNLDVLIAAVKDLDLMSVGAELQARGSTFSGTGDALRKELCSLVIRVAAEPAKDQPSLLDPEYPAGPPAPVPVEETPEQAAILAAAKADQEKARARRRPPTLPPIPGEAPPAGQD